MTDGAVTTTTVTEALARWRVDARITELFVGPTNSALAVWIAELDLGTGAKDLRCLYAWVIATAGGEPGVTEASEKWQTLGKSASRFRLRRVVYRDTAPAVERVISQMLSGGTLGESVSGVTTPCDCLRLGLSAEDVAQKFDPAPVRFLPTASASSAGSEWGRPLSSPSQSQPAFVAALVRCKKAALFSDNAGNPTVAADFLARESLKYLNHQTGFHFDAADAPRLGNIEWLTLPAADTHEQGDVRWHTVTSDIDGRKRVEAVRVTVTPGRLPDGMPLIVRCRVLAAHEAAADVCVESHVGRHIDFPVEYEITAVHITIWTLDGEKRGTLWFEDHVPLIRQTSIAMGLMGLSGSLETGWSASLETSRRSLRERADKVRAIQHIHYESPAAVGRLAAWESAQREGEALARRLFPAKSDARFFERGWTSEGRLSFVEWLRGLTEDPSVSSLVLNRPLLRRPRCARVSRACEGNPGRIRNSDQ